MENTKKIEWILRVAVAGEFIGHGVFALQGKEGWFKYFYPLGISNVETITSILFALGMLDLALAVLISIKPISIVLLWFAS